MIDKTGYNIQMNVAISDSEKQSAETAVKYFDELLFSLQDLIEYLDLIYLPFSKYSNIDMSEIVKYRETFRKYRDQVENKFTKVIKNTYNCVSQMKEFEYDTNTKELMTSFIGLIKNLETYMETFISIFTNLNNESFRNNLIATIDAIKKQKNQIKQLITDRIFPHIDENILDKSWTDSISQKLNEKPIKDKVPLVVQLFQERQQALKGR